MNKKNSKTNHKLSPLKRWLGLAGWIVLSFGAALPGAFFMPGEWYESLSKPAWNPPAWLFGPVWTVLYMLMAVAVWLVWQRGGFAVQRRPLALFLVQLVLNAAWTPLFFGLHRPGLAFFEIIVLWIAILMTVLAFHRNSRIAAWLLVLYLLWVSFAAVLNAVLLQLNL